MAENGTYCGEGWYIFWNQFRPHIPAMKIGLCVMGLITNILNLIVFTRKSMRNPTNILLTALACSDLLCALRLLEDSVLFKYLKSQHFPPNTFAIAVMNLMNEISVNLFHSWSIYLTLGIALWRLYGVSRPMHSIRWFTKTGALRAIVGCVVMGIMVMIPMYYCAYIKPIDNRPTIEYTWTLDSDWYLYLWMHTIAIEVIPCALLTIATTALVMKLIKASIEGKSMRPNFQRDGTAETASTNATNQQIEFDRTSRMLIVLLVVFLISELPFAILNLFNIVLGYEFQKQCKQAAVTFFNSGQYFIGATTFFVYLFMSNNFRKTFCNLFRSCNILSESSSSNDSTQSSGTKMWELQK